MKRFLLEKILLPVIRLYKPESWDDFFEFLVTIEGLEDLMTTSDNELQSDRSYLPDE